MRNFTIWGRYDADYHARLALRCFEDQPGAYHRVRYMPDERYPAEPYVLAVFDWEHDADAFDSNGELRA